jgi:phage terminase large subunit
LSSTLQIPTPAAFLPLLGTHRFKGAKGGRGAAKSHFFCESLVEDMLTDHTRVACLREVQSSIKDSVKQLVEDKIKSLGVESLFKITDLEITGPNESLMVFRGLKSHTATSIKSLEGFKRAFVEEAQTISQRSLDMLIPTIRAPGSQLLFSWNPVSPKDPVDKFFLENVNDPDFVLINVTWQDNPWFPPELRRDMERDRRRDPEKYQHVWLGSYQKNSEARVFRNWKIDTFDVPKDARPYYGGDWGFAIDPTVLVRCWIIGRTLYIDQEAYEVGCAIDKTPALFDKVEGSRKWPITADSARPETIDYMRRHGFPHIQPARKGPGSLEDGVEFLKSFDIVVHPSCKHVIDELSSYSYKTDKLTAEILPVLDDKKNHTIDAVRYAAEQVRAFDGGTVYATPETDLVIDPEFKLPRFWPRVWALDIDGAKASILWAAHDRENDTIYIYGELVTQRHELALVCDAIKTRNRAFGDMPGLFDHRARKRSDQEGQHIINALLDILRTDQLFTPHIEPEAAIPEVTRRLSTKRLKVLQSCPQWLAQYRAYRRNKDGDIVEESDGLMRAMDLLVMEGTRTAALDDASVAEAENDWAGKSRSTVTGY